MSVLETSMNDRCVGEELEYARKLCVSTPYMEPGINISVEPIVEFDPEGLTYNIRAGAVSCEIYNASPAAKQMNLEFRAGPFDSVSRCIYDWNQKVRIIMSLLTEDVEVKWDDESNGLEVEDYLYID